MYAIFQTPFAKKRHRILRMNFLRTNVDEIDPRSEDCVKVNSIACRRTTPPSHFRAITYNPNTSEMSANFFKNFSSKIPFTLFSPKKSLRYKKCIALLHLFYKIQLYFNNFGYTFRYQEKLKMVKKILLKYNKRCEQ
jgi:hypothetical protein